MAPRNSQWTDWHHSHAQDVYHPSQCRACTSIWSLTHIYQININTNWFHYLLYWTQWILNNFVKNLPVSLISTTQSSETFSNNWSRETSCWCRPGSESSARISSIKTGLDESVASKSLCLRFRLPFSLLYVVFPILFSLSISRLEVQIHL